MTVDQNIQPSHGPWRPQAGFSTQLTRHVGSSNSRPWVCPVQGRKLGSVLLTQGQEHPPKGTHRLRPPKMSPDLPKPPWGASRPPLRTAAVERHGISAPRQPQETGVTPAPWRWPLVRLEGYTPRQGAGQSPLLPAPCHTSLPALLSRPRSLPARDPRTPLPLPE